MILEEKRSLESDHKDIKLLQTDISAAMPGKRMKIDHSGEREEVIQFRGDDTASDLKQDHHRLMTQKGPAENHQGAVKNNGNENLNNCYEV